eukprot:1162154-Pelagomonas_calceolata.AAC.5
MACVLSTELNGFPMGQIAYNIRKILLRAQRRSSYAETVEKMCEPLPVFKDDSGAGYDDGTGLFEEMIEVSVRQSLWGGVDASHGSDASDDEELQDDDMEERGLLREEESEVPAGKRKGRSKRIDYEGPLALNADYKQLRDLEYLEQVFKDVNARPSLYGVTEQPERRLEDCMASVSPEDCFSLSWDVQRRTFQKMLGMQSDLAIQRSH